MSSPPASDKFGKAPRERGLLVTFEGGEGSGKSTQAALLVEWLRERGVPVTAAREPGGTPVGEAIRGIVLDPALSVGPVAELLLVAAARAQIVRDIVTPALAEGRVVVLDRYEDSTFAYQGGARGLPERTFAPVNALATGGLRADLTVLIDVEPGEGRRRRDADRGVERDRPRDRMEAEAGEFHERVRRAYLARASGEPERFLVIDGRGSPTTIQDEVRRRVLAALGPERAEPLP